MGKIRFEGVPHVNTETSDKFKAVNRSLDLPAIKPGVVGVAAHKLAVVGGSPEVNKHIDELREWDGEILAVNGSWQHLYDHGIKSTFYTIDPVAFPPRKVEKAVLGDCVNPSMVKDLADDGVEIDLVWIGRDQIQNFSTSAATVPMFAFWRGHKEVTFFGCGSSYDGKTHEYKDERSLVDVLWVECGGEEFETSPQMIMQAEQMAETIREFPQFLKVRGRGFLGALVEHGDYDITHISRNMAETLKKLETAAARGE